MYWPQCPAADLAVVNACLQSQLFHVPAPPPSGFPVPPLMWGWQPPRRALSARTLGTAPCLPCGQTPVCSDTVSLLQSWFKKKKTLLRDFTLSKAFPFFFRFYLFIHDRHRKREKGRDTGRGRSRLHAEPDVELDFGSPGSHPELKAAPNRWATGAALMTRFR